MVGAFTYHKAIAPMLWVLIGLSLVELVVVHLLLAHWWPRVAIIVAGVTMLGIGWLVHCIASFRRLPVLVDDESVLMRVGRLRSVRIPAARICSVAPPAAIADLKGGRVLNLALIAYPNIVLRLDPPIRAGRREISTVAHRLDDPAGFAAAVNRLGATHD